MIGEFSSLVVQTAYFIPTRTNVLPFHSAERGVDCQIASLLEDAFLLSLYFDWAGLQGSLVRCIGGCDEGQIWRRQLHNGDVAVAFINLKESQTDTTCMSLADLGVEGDFNNMQVKWLISDWRDMRWDVLQKFWGTFQPVHDIQVPNVASGKTAVVLLDIVGSSLSAG